MARKYNATELINLVRDEARIPNTASTGNADSDILNRINEYMLDTLVGLVMEVKDEYFVRTIRQPLAASTSRYRIPDRAMYQKLRDIRYIGSNTENGYSSLAHISVGSLDSSRSSTSTNNIPSAFRIEGNHIVLWPAISAGAQGSIDIAYYLTPGELGLPSAAAVGTGKNTDRTQATFVDGTVPTAWTAADTFDIHSPNSGAEVKAVGRSISSLGTTAINFSEAVDGSVTGEYELEIGDYVCLTGEAALPGLPRELHPLIAIGAACTILQDEGDMDVYQAKLGLLERSLFGRPDGKSIGAIGRMQNRVDARPIYVTGGRFLAAQDRYA